MYIRVIMHQCNHHGLLINLIDNLFISDDVLNLLLLLLLQTYFYFFLSYQHCQNNIFRSMYRYLNNNISSRIGLYTTMYYKIKT